MVTIKEILNSKVDKKWLPIFECKIIPVPMRNENTIKICTKLSIFGRFYEIDPKHLHHFFLLIQ